MRSAKMRKCEIGQRIKCEIKCEHLFAFYTWPNRIITYSSKCVVTYQFTSLNLFSVNIHVHQKPSSAIFREGIRLGLVYRVRVSFR